MYTCHDDYVLIGNNILSCLQPPQWDNGPPTCRAMTPPDLNTCRVSVSDANGNTKNSTYTGNKTDCQSQRDEGIRTQPTELYFSLKADLEVHFGDMPHHVNPDSVKVGVVGASISLVKVNLSGWEHVVHNETLVGLPYCQQNVSSDQPVTGGLLHDCEGAIRIPVTNLSDGESLCADMEATSGGSFDLLEDYTSTPGHFVLPTFSTSKRVCFTYDMTKPVHCSQTNAASCNSRPLQLSARLTRRPQVEVHVEGWFDPIPDGGTENSASHIDRYRVEVHGVDADRSLLSVQDDARTDHTVEWNANISARGGPYDVTVTLPEEGAARLYAIILEVHDKAGNVANARRLLLYDNSSTVQLLPSASLQVVSGNPSASLSWQTDVADDICLDWKDRFYNSDLRDNNFLLPVKTDTGREIHGDYDQQSGLLPTSGTDNVKGVVRFEVSWSRDESPRSPPEDVQELFNESVCLHQPLKDGETYDVWVRGTDIMGNFREDSVRVSIDHTGPSVSIGGLRGRFGRDGLYVHNTTDLSTMVLLVQAADPHSGLRTLQWTLGTRDLAHDVGEGAIGVNRLDNVTDCFQREHCYCPSVGSCELQQYFFTFSNLVSNNSYLGQHHREYYVTITATNHASLRSRQTLEIVIDESPPTVGVVLEGLSDDDQAETDFTSSHVLHVRWHGFQDHESGILLYRVLLADRCLTDEEMDAADNATEIGGRESTAVLTFPREGRYFVSIVAYNGALQPSGLACSDGVTYDSTPPSILNVSITHGQTRRSVACTQPDQPWLINANLTRVKLAGTKACLDICRLNSSAEVQHLPVTSYVTLEEDLSTDLCLRLKPLTEEDLIVLPSDYLRLTWAGEDEESEMEEYYVGVGRDRTTASAPDLVPFTRTHGHHSYRARHAGLGHGAVFFIFLRAVSKAGLHVQVTLGPVIIDVTPPDVTQLLTAVVEGDYLVTNWPKDAFSDSEQPADVRFHVTYRVGYTESFVTPFLSMPESSLAQCGKNNISGCVRYPVRALHPHDTEQGRSFFFQLHIANAAGHVTTVNTSSVQLPVHYSPSHVVVMDILKTGLRAVNPPQIEATTDPTSSASTFTSSASEDPVVVTSIWPTTEQETKEELFTFTEDVDVFLERDEVCVTWGDFHHKDEVKVAVGLGSSFQQDDILPFVQTEQRPFCFNATGLPPYRKLFSVVRANSAGGTTILPSDGFRIIPRHDTDNRLMVFNGKGCSESDIIAVHEIAPSMKTNLNITSVFPLHLGDVVFVRFKPPIPQVTFPSSRLLFATLEGYQLLLKSSAVQVTLSSPASANTSMEILNCLKEPALLPVPRSHVSVTWEMIGPWTQFAKYLKVEVMDEDCMNTGQKKEKYKRLQCRLAEGRVHLSHRQLNIHGETVSPGHSYTASVSVCFDDECLPPEYSNPVKYEDDTRAVTFLQASIISQSPQQIESRFEASVSPPVSVSPAEHVTTCVYTWTITRDAAGLFPLADWRLAESHNCSDIQVQDILEHVGSGFGTLYLCLRPVYPWKADYPTCHTLSRPNSLNQEDPFHVIEMSQSTFLETSFEEFLHSLGLGSKLHELYNLDLDFAESDVALSAILTNGEGKSVTWYLLTNPRVPAEGTCAGNVACVASKHSDDGTVVFSRAQWKLEDGRLYFICASVLSPDNTAGHYPVDVCGDGIFIDDSPPIAGSVSIGNTNSAFLADGSRVQVTWKGFSDGEEMFTGTLHEDTMSYSVALGSYPGGEDITNFLHVGQRTAWTFEHLDIRSGSTCIATVRAKDRVGHVTESWSRSVIIDSTPPAVKYLAVGSATLQRFVPGHSLPVRWEAEDLDSGVKTCEVAIISAEGQEEVVPFDRFHGNSALLTQTSGLWDGHSYVALLKVTNGAGLSTLAQSPTFTADSSPPAPGRVWNSAGNNTEHSAYSTDAGVYHVYWAGFSDPHSGLHYYRVALGSQPHQTDIHPFVYVGLQTSYVWRQEFSQGQKYYVTVEACNRAGLCRMESSSGLIFDNSPPTSGRVTVGFDGHHSKYLGHNSSLAVQWTGFSDPQTGIEEFWWCVGRTPGGCEVAPSVHTLLSQTTVRSGLALPVATPLYVTVRARNPAGLETVGVSRSFLVDISPPEIIAAPEFLSTLDGGPINSQRERSLLRLSWQFGDPDSSVAHQTVSIRSQLTGRLVTEPVMLTTETEVTLVLEWDRLLLDGDQYWAVVTACNAAGLCSTANSSLLLIDSTPPVMGTFLSSLPWVKNASPGSGAPLTRVNVTWTGFADAESGVVRYFLSAGRRYNGQELSRGQTPVGHDSSTRRQSCTLGINEDLEFGEVVHLSVYAENGLGLISRIARMEFRVFFDDTSGTAGTWMSVRHSCEASYCTGECTCAAEGNVCRANRSSCSAWMDSHPLVKDLDIISYIGPQSKPQEISTSVKCLEGHWRLSDPTLLPNISRFEWSFSLANMSAGQGVFHVQNETVWHDVGTNMAAVHCLPGRRVLTSGRKYILHVRAWLSSDDHVTFTSSPVMVDSSPPQIKRGRSVMDSDGACTRDIDYVTTAPQITACWNDVFQDSQSQIARYEVWLGTSQYAEDVVKKTDLGSNTTWTFHTASLERGTHYYVTVRAVNRAGLMTTAVSDGIAVDVTPPVSGVVFNARGHANRHAQSSTTTLQASWHGFQDQHSGVTSYLLALYDVSDARTPLVPFHTAGIQTAYTFNNITLKDKHRYQVVVMATDAGGLQSKPASSQPILVDTTAPEGVACTDYQLVDRKNMGETRTTWLLQDTYSAQFALQKSAKDRLVKLFVEASNLRREPEGHIVVGEMKMPLYFRYSQSSNTTAQHLFIVPDSDTETLSVVVAANSGARVSAELYRCLATTQSDTDSVTVHQVSQHRVSVCSLVHDEESGIKSTLVGVGTTPGGLQVQPLTPIGHGGHAVVDVHVQHGIPLYASVHVENHAGLWSRFISQPVTMDRTPPEIKVVNLLLRYDDGSRGFSTLVTAEAEWVAEDAESGVTSCTCELDGQRTADVSRKRATGTSPGRCQWLLQRPQHGASVRVKVGCVNGVHIHETKLSDDVTVLLQSPDLMQVSVMSISNNAMMSPFKQSDPNVRSANSSLEFCLHGSLDPTVSQLQYRFLHELSPAEDWSPLNIYKPSFLLERTDQRLPTGSLTAQVRAVNARRMTSNVASTAVELDDSKPTLTGHAASATWSNGDVQLNWHDVFRVNRDVTYTVYAGTAEGYGDVINHVITEATVYKGPCAKPPSYLYATITAVYANGLSSIYQAELRL